MKVTHAVSAEGAVFCAQQQRIVDVITCYGCDRVVRIDLDSNRPKVVCAIAAPGEAAAV